MVERLSCFRGGGNRRNGRTVALSVALGALVLLGSAPAASAHTEPVFADPAAGAVLAELPPVVDLVFDDPLAEAPLIVSVVDPTGAEHVVDVHASGTTLSADLGPGPAGEYRLSYRVAGDDGHVVDGGWAFRAESAVPTDPAVTTDPAAVEPGAETVAEPSAEPSAESVAEPTPAPGAVASPVASAPAGGGRSSLGLEVAVIALLAWLVSFVLLLVRQRRRRAPGRGLDALGAQHGDACTCPDTATVATGTPTEHSTEHSTQDAAERSDDRVAAGSARARG